MIDIDEEDLAKILSDMDAEKAWTTLSYQEQAEVILNRVRGLGADALNRLALGREVMDNDGDVWVKRESARSQFPWYCSARATSASTGELIGFGPLRLLPL